MQPQEDLIVKAALLARTSRKEWDDFLLALNNYKEAQKERLVSSALADLQQCQGKAQALTALCTQLADCVSKSDQIARKVNK